MSGVYELVDSRDGEVVDVTFSSGGSIVFSDRGGSVIGLSSEQVIRFEQLLQLVKNGQLKTRGDDKRG